MSSPHKSPRSSNNGTKSTSIPSSPEKKPSLPARVIRGTAVQMISFVLAVLILGIGYAAVTWTNIPSGSGASGQPVNQTLMQGIINNMNDLNSRLTDINPSGVNIQGDKFTDTNDTNYYVNPSSTSKVNTLYIDGNLYDTDNTGYYLNPASTSNFNVMSGKTLCINGDCKTGWPGSGTSGGIVTGPLRWSREYSGQTYDQAWATCLGLSPTGSWRIPSENELEIGRHINAGLFTGNKNYWSSSPNFYASATFYAYDPTAGGPYGSRWNACTANSSTSCYYGANSPFFRCVSNAN